MIQLITISDIKPLKAISANANTSKKVDPFILEAQQFELKKLMGDAFYFAFVSDFMQSPPLPTYYDLFNGSTFTHCGNTIRHEGLKTVLAYLSYARYVLNSNVEATAFGTVHKNTEESERVDEKTILRLYDQAYAGAMEYWNDVQKFLNAQDYELWNNCSDKNITTTRIGAVSPDNFCDNHKKRGRRWR